MQVRRCALLLIEPVERLVFDFASLLEGGDGSRLERHWRAWAAHLDDPVEVRPEELHVLGRAPVSQWIALDALLGADDLEPDAVMALLDKGLLVAEEGPHAELGRRDQRLRDAHWTVHSAVAHYASRWSGVNADPESLPPAFESMDALVAQLGEPPRTFGSHPGAQARIPLDRPSDTALDLLLKQRVTCRNFSARALARAELERILHRVVAAQATVDSGTGGLIAKKNSPSGGGLHPLEAYLLVQRVEGLTPGVYHYHAGEHVLEQLQACDAAAMADVCNNAVAGQRYFAAAPVLLVFTARFRRSYWKYRAHAKAYRSILIELGHMSQNLYLSATELGLAAFVTAAINERDIERCLMLDPTDEGPLAVCGLGYRDGERRTIELDPLGTVWSPPAATR